MILIYDISKKRSRENQGYDNGKRLYAVNQYLNCSLIVVFMLTHCFVSVQGVKSFCMAPTVELGKAAFISCHLGEDISRIQQDVIVYIYKDNGRKPVVRYAWINGQPLITQENGYECDKTISEYLVVRIPNTTREHAAQYSCIVAPSDKEEVTPCTLKLTDGSTTTQAEHVGSVRKSDAGITFSSSTLHYTDYSDVQSSSKKEKVNQESEDVPWETPVIIILSFIFGILTVLILRSVLIAKKYDFFPVSWTFNCINAQNTPNRAAAPVNDVEMPLKEGNENTMSAVA